MDKILIFVLALLLNIGVANAQAHSSTTSLLNQSIIKFLPLANWVGPVNYDAINREKFVITEVVNTSSIISVNAEDILTKPSFACSVYDTSVCHDVSDKYKNKQSSFLAYGYYRIDPDNLISFGFNSGYESEKLTIDPSVSIGGARRIYSSADRNMQIVVEGNFWLGGGITHRPCLDDYGREYYCANLTAWSDFSYESRPKSYNFRIIYEVTF